MQNTVTAPSHEVIVRLINARGEIRSVRKEFRTDAAMTKWLDVQEEKGHLLSVEAFSA